MINDCSTTLSGITGIGIGGGWIVVVVEVDSVILLKLLLVAMLTDESSSSSYSSLGRRDVGVPGYGVLEAYLLRVTCFLNLCSEMERPILLTSSSSSMLSTVLGADRSTSMSPVVDRSMYDLCSSVGVCS